MIRCSIWIVSSLAGTTRQQRDPDEQRAAPAVRVQHRRRATATSAAVPSAIAAEIARRRVAKKRRRIAASAPGAPADAVLELLAAAADQVVADVRAARVGRLHGHLPRPLDALQRAARSCASPVGSASSSTAWRYRSRLRKSIRP